MAGDIYPILNIDDDFDNINCKSINPTEMTSLFNEYKNNAFSLIGFNVRSCKKNF